MEDLKNIWRYELVRPHLFEVGSIYCADYQVIVANKLWYAGGEKVGKNILDLMFVNNEKIAKWTIAAWPVEHYKLHRVHMDEERVLAQKCSITTLRAGSEAFVLVRIKKDAVARF